MDCGKESAGQWSEERRSILISPCHTLVNVYVALPVFTRIAGTS